MSDWQFPMNYTNTRIMSFDYSKIKIKETFNNDKLGDLERVKKNLSIQRRMYLFIFIIILKIAETCKKIYY